MVCGSNSNFGYRFSSLIDLARIYLHFRTLPLRFLRAGLPTWHNAFWELESLSQFKVMRLENEATAPEPAGMSISDACAHCSRHTKLPAVKVQVRYQLSTTLFYCPTQSSSVLVTSPSLRLHWRDLSQNTPPVAASREALAWPASQACHYLTDLLDGALAL